MRIKKIKINSYGTLKEKEINLKNNINIIYGKNESGKSTLLNFIKNIFYGISKNKNGKEISDYEKYLPWSGEEFSGKIEYELQNQNSYEVYRDFTKKNPKIFNDKLEDITQEYKIDKKDGSQFFVEQTGISEQTYSSTVMSAQQEVILDKQSQNILVQRIANLGGTGEEALSFQKVLDRLNKRWVEEVGTARTQDRPINFVQNRLKQIDIVLKDSNSCFENKENLEEKRNKFSRKLQQEKETNNLISKLTMLTAENQIAIEQINIKNKIKNENQEKLKKIIEQKQAIIQKNETENNYLLNNEIGNINLKQNNEKNENENINSKLNYQNNKSKIENKKQNEKKEIKNLKEKTKEQIKNKLNKKIKRNKIIFSIIFILLIITNIFNFIFIPNKIINYFILAFIPIEIILFMITYLKNNKKIKIIGKQLEIEKQENQKQQEQINLFNSQIQLLKEEIEKQEKEIKNEQEQINLKISKEKQKIKEQYPNIENEELFAIQEKNKIEQLLKKSDEKIMNYQIQLNSIQFEENTMAEQIEKIVLLKEEREGLQEQLNLLEEKNKCFQKTKELLETAYEKMKNNVTPKFTQNLSNIVKQLSGGKYQKVSIHEEKGLIVELENGEYIPAHLLSTGTIDQLYLSLRLSMLDEISKEKMPIILDETFAYFDEERLKNILLFLEEKAKEHQIILFTCTNREKELLDKLQIEYNLVEL